MIHLKPADKIGYINRGEARRRKGEVERAIADFDQAIAIDPKDSSSWFNRGIAHSDNGDPDPVKEVVVTLRRRRRVTLGFRGRVDHVLGGDHRVSVPGERPRKRSGACYLMRANSSTCPSGTGPSAVSHDCASQRPHRRNVTSRSAIRIRISTSDDFEHLGQRTRTSQHHDR